MPGRQSQPSAQDQYRFELIMGYNNVTVLKNISVLNVVSEPLEYRLRHWKQNNSFFLFFFSAEYFVSHIVACHRFSWSDIHNPSPWAVWSTMALSNLPLSRKQIFHIVAIVLNGDNINVFTDKWIWLWDVNLRWIRCLSYELLHL